MNKAILRMFMLLWIGVLGLMMTGSATTWNIANGASTATIQNTINGSASGDTISFYSGGSYSVTAKITLLGTRTYTGNGCTLNWAGSLDSMIYMINASNLTISGFTFNGNANCGNVYIDTGCSALTFTNNTIENNSYWGSWWEGCNGLFSQENSNGVGLTNSYITFNTIHDILGGGIGMYSPGNTQVTDNTFYNISHCDQIGGCFDGSGSYISNNTVFARNIITNNCGRIGIEFGGGPGGGLFSVSNLLIDSNVIAEQYGDNNGDGSDGSEMAISLVSPNVGTVISNNNLSGSNPASFMEVLEYASDDGSVGPLNGHLTKNIFHDTPWGIAYDDNYNMNVLMDYNLFVNIGNSPVWNDGTSINHNGAADVCQYNWAYGCTLNTSNYPNNSNLSGSCPTISIAKTSDATVGGSNGVFTITSSLAPSQNTAISYTLSGTGGYTVTPASPATITSGQTSTTLSVQGVSAGTCIATLAFGPYYINSSSKSATMNINAGVSLPTVTVAASPTSVNEASGSSTYTVTRTGATTSALTVNYAMSGAAVNGTDYTTLSGSMTIASGSASGTVTLTAIDRAIVAGSKTAILTISTNANYTVGSPGSATVTINDNDTSAIPTANLLLWHKGDAGVTKDGSNNVSKWTDLSGNGLDSTQNTTGDYPLYVASDVNSKPGLRFNGSSQYLNALCGTLNFSAGASFFAVTNPTGTSAYGRIIETSSGNNFIGLMRDNTNQDWQFYSSSSGGWPTVYSSGSTNLTQNTWQMVEAVEASNGGVTLYKNDANPITGTDQVPSTVALTGDIGGSAPNSQYWTGDFAEIIVYNTALTTTNRQTVENYLMNKYAIGTALPTVTVSASPSSINENAGTSTYTVTRTGATTSALTVNYAMSGTATNGTDYNTLSGSMTIASGSATGTVTLTAKDRGLTSGSCTAILTLSSNANYTVGSPSNATVTINDNDLPTVTVSASPTSVNEANGTSTYTVTRTDSTTALLAVNYAMSGTAVNGTDYSTLSGSLTIASGSTTGTVTLNTIDRGLTSGSVTAILTISTNANYTVGSPSNATVTINDNDVATTTGTIDDANAAITYSGFTGGTGGSQPGDYAGTEHYSNTTNAYAQYTFTATAVTVVGKKGPNYGIAGIYIDGTLKATVDCYVNSGSGGITQQNLYAISGLSASAHTVKVVVTGTKNASASDYYVTVDAFDFPPTSTFPTSGLQLWLKGDLGAAWDGTTSVAGWSDMSVNHMDATQATAGNKPTWVNNDLNSIPGIRFNGTSQYLQMPSGFTGFNNGVTAFVVTNPTGASAWGRTFEIGDGGSNYFGMMRDNTNQDWEFYVNTTGAGWGAVDSSGTTNLTQSTFQLLEMTETSGGSATIYKNGGNAISGTAVVPSNQTYTNNYIGATLTNNTQYWTGDIVEVILYNSALTTTQRQAVESYLSTKYGQSW